MHIAQLWPSLSCFKSGLERVCKRRRWPTSRQTGRDKVRLHTAASPSGRVSAMASEKRSVPGMRCPTRRAIAGQPAHGLRIFSKRLKQCGVAPALAHGRARGRARGGARGARRRPRRAQRRAARAGQQGARAARRRCHHHGRAARRRRRVLLMRVCTKRSASPRSRQVHPATPHAYGAATRARLHGR